MNLIIVGCGLGGLSCAIQCRREGVQVLMLEKAAELSEVGAGIQLPPNATRIMHDLGLLDKLYSAGMNPEGERRSLRWQDGAEIGSRPGNEWAKIKFGHYWHLMHRADYQTVLVDEARRLGVEIRLDCDVISVEANDIEPVVVLSTGERIVADVVVGADGLRSRVRAAVLGFTKQPEESGDLAYRMTVPREALEDENDPFIQDLLCGKANGIWWGQDSHVVAYCIRNFELVNIVLCCPDNLPAEVARQPGNLEEMWELFEGWDSRLRTMLSKVDNVLKWKIWGMEELDYWVKGAVALLGDACHPSPPYAASGAAMAVEDGVTLARIIGLFTRSGHPKSSLPTLMQLYETVRKARATSVVKLSNDNRKLYHMIDGAEQEYRDRMFKGHDWWDENLSFPWQYADAKALSHLHAFDTFKVADEAFANSQFAQKAPDSKQAEAL